MKLKRMTAALLLLAMLLSCLPLSVLAADAEPVEAENTVDAAPAEDAEAAKPKRRTNAKRFSSQFMRILFCGSSCALKSSILSTSSA